MVSAPLRAPVILESLDDPRVRCFAHVRDPELLRHNDAFVAESKPVVRAALSSRYHVEKILCTQAALADLAPAIDATHAPVEVFIAEPRQIAELAGFAMHRGALAWCRRGAPWSDTEVFGEPATPRLVLVLVGLSDPDNVGTLFRTARAFGVDGLVLDTTTADPLYRKAIRTSLGHVLRLPFARLPPEVDLLEQLRQQGLTTFALTPGADAEALEPSTAPPRLAVLVGNEGLGLPATILARADRRLRISMSGALDSLNVAAAGAIALHHFRRSPSRAPRR